MSKGEIHTIDSKLEVTGNQMFVSGKNLNEKKYHLDKEIWNAFKDGSLTAYKSIYEKHIDLLFNYGNKITQHKELVEDCMQDLFVDLWIKKSKLGVVLNIKAYLFISFRRRLIDGLNKRKKRLGIDFADNLEFFFKDSFDSDLISNEKKTKLISILNALPPQKKEAIFLRFYNELSCAEISEIMKIKTQSVYNLISTGLKVMKKAFIFLLPISQIIC